ncbi:MAG TPA: 16S rRNA (uracil(1498)-N(3))-methyltransferase [Spirochaetes bacterium]|nr:16S rRNA (uracil(1498)-N(3))-methyltransferase [Spirochaetota bacterium]
MKNIFLDLNCLHGDKVIISDDDFHYLKNVRRIRKGNTLDAVIGDGKYRLVVSNVDKKSLECDIVAGRKTRNENIVRIQVFQGLLKAKKMDFVVSKLSELGVEALFPLNTSRTVPVVDPRGSRSERWRKIAAEGSKISGIETVMQVKDPVDICKIRGDFKSEGLPVEGKQALIVFSTAYTGCHIKQLLDTLDFSHDMMFSLFFGPEGGFSNKEIKSLLDINGIPVSMGGLVLRSETATVVGAGFVRLYYSFRN